MLGLKLRDEFLGSQMPNTAISLRRADNKGAAQQAPEQILEITYPTADVQTALCNIGTARAGRPVVLMGDPHNGSDASRHPILRCCRAMGPGLGL